MHLKHSLMKKIIVGITVVSMVTYGTSAFFIFYLKDYFPWIPNWLFDTLTLGLGIFWTSLLGWIAAKYLIKPLIILTEVANKTAAGYLNAQIPISKSDDELRALSLSFSKMIDNLRQMVEDILGNFQITEKNVEELKGATEQAAIQIESISHTVESISFGSDRQVQTANQVFTSIEKGTQLANEVKDRAVKAKTLSMQMEKTMNESGEVVHSLVNGMKIVSSSNENSLDMVRSLEQKTKEISEISDIVGQMASQTNLLALNATIEAARAGEHGLGFSVVATEIRTLADQSSEAVNNINERIVQIQSLVVGVVNQINDQVKMARQETQKGETANAALNQIDQSVVGVVEAVDEISEMINKQVQQMHQIFEGSKEVSEVAGLVSTGAKEVASSTQEQTAVMQEIASSTHVLKEQALNLKEKINQFTL